MIAGTLTYDTKMDTKGLEKDAKNGFSKVKDIVAGLGITKIISKAFNVLTSSMDSAINRLDTINNFPRVMSNMGVDAQTSSEAIQDLSDRLKGIPTTLDDAVLSVERFTSKNGDVKKSVEIFDAVNNAILAGGASTQIQTSALEQLSQAYSKGKPDMMEWRTLQMAMPAQLNQVAKAMGKTTDQLGEDLRKGKIPMDDFINTIIKLNKEGANGFVSFEQQAKNSTGGIKTSLANMKTAVTRGVATIIESFSKGIESAGFGTLGDNISKIGVKAEKVLKVISEKIREYLPIIIGKIKEIIDKIRKWLTENKVGEAIKKIGEIVKTVANEIINFFRPVYNFIREKIIPVIKNFAENLIFKIRYADLEQLKDILKAILPIITGVVAGFVAFKTVTTIITTIKSVQTAFKSLFATISANPVGALIALFTAVAVASKVAVDKMIESFKNAEKDMTNRIGKIQESFDKYGEKIQQAKGYLDGFNTRLFQTESEQMKLEEDLKKIQNDFTAITKRASDERRSLTDSEIQKLDEYFEKLKELRDKQISIEEQVSKAITQQAKTVAENLSVSYDEYNEKSANYIKTSQEQRDKQVDLIEKSFTEEIVLLNQKFGDEASMTNEAYAKMYKMAENRRDKAVESANDEVTQVTSAFQKGYDTIVGKSKSSIDTLNTLTNARIMTINKMKEIDVGALSYDTAVTALKVKTYKEYMDGLEQIDKKIVENLDDATAEQLGIWAKNLEETKKAGGDITAENEQLAENLIRVYSSLDEEGRKKMEGMMSSLKNIVRDNKSPIVNETKELASEMKSPLEGLEPVGAELSTDYLRGVYNGLQGKLRSAILGNISLLGANMLSNLKNSLKEESPSKATYQMAEFFLQGFDNAIKDNKNDVLKTVDDFGNEVLGKMSNAVNLETGKINAKAFLTNNTNRYIQLDASFDGIVEMDNRKVGRIVAPNVSKALKVGGL